MTTDLVASASEHIATRDAVDSPDLFTETGQVPHPSSGLILLRRCQNSNGQCH